MVFSMLLLLFLHRVIINADWSDEDDVPIGSAFGIVYRFVECQPTSHWHDGDSEIGANFPCCFHGLGIDVVVLPGITLALTQPP